jgi:xanthine dehydrogenase accessory factor
VERDLLELAASLHKQHRPFVVATVVWSRSPSSGKAGGTAIIEQDGTVHGWIGGACAEPAVVREARRVMNDGESRLMYLGPADELDGSARDGVMTIPIACASEGALEVFMEPVLPQPHIVVVGRSPGVKTLVRLLLALDWRATAVDDGGDPGEWPAGVAVHTSLDSWEAAGVDDVTGVVVATQGHYDEPALEAALRSPAPYLGLVASATRAPAVLGYLRDRGFSEADVARIDTPAGIDLGHVEHREIAVAILAELVRRRAAGLVRGAAEIEASAPAEPATAIDPVCGMTVDVAGARFVSEHETGNVYFCCPACKKIFEDEPAAYV